MTQYRHEAVVFRCAESDLVGVLTVPEAPKTVGIVTVVAGGPQYRVGVGRGLVELSRILGENGYPTLRFDYRGMGDSGGDFKNFCFIKEDIDAAVHQLRLCVPEIEKVVLWGGCNAASAIMMFAHEIPGVSGMIINNPFVESEGLEDKARQSHYLDRFKDADFWKKLVCGKYFNRSTVSELYGLIVKRLFPAARNDISSASVSEVSAKPYPYLMLEGMQNFSGNCLLVVSGNSVDAKRFKVLVEADKSWCAAVSDNRNVEQFGLSEADQGLSTHADRKKLFSKVVSWLSTEYT